jgi:SAM-dependent methyltransferase
MTPVWFAAAVSDWDKIFDEVYLRTWAALLDPALAPAQAEGVLSLVGLESDADLLDCPCGYGRHSIEFARFGLHVIGADRSEVLLAEAKRRAGDAEWPRWARADYRELPFEDASFDHAYSVSVLEHIPEPGDEQALRELARVTRPGGRVVITLPHAAAHREDWRDAPVYAAQGGSPGRHFFQRWYDPARLERLAAAAPDLELVSSCASRMEPNLNELYTRTFPLVVPLGPLFGLLARRVEGPGGDVVRLTFRRH